MLHALGRQTRENNGPMLYTIWRQARGRAMLCYVYFKFYLGKLGTHEIFLMKTMKTHITNHLRGQPNQFTLNHGNI